MPKVDLDKLTITKASETGSLPEGARTDEDIEEMFDFVFVQVENTSGFYEVLLSLYEWWEKKGFLTAGQYETLVATYDRHGGQ